MRKSSSLFLCRFCLINQNKQIRVALSQSSSDFKKLLSLVDKTRSPSHQDENLPLPSSSPPSIRVIGNGYAGSPKSLLINAGDGRKYLVNCGESTSRVLTETRELDEIKDLDVVLTRSTWTHSLSGIFGLIYSLTCLNKSASSSIRFHAPFDTPRFLYDTFHTLKLKSIRFDRHDKRVLHANKSSVRIEHLPIFSNDVYAYLFTLDNNMVVLVVDLPEPKHLDKFADKYSSELKQRGVDVFVHLSPSSVLTSWKYKQTVEKMCRGREDSARHLVFDESSFNLVSKDVYVQQTFLNRLDSFVFPLLYPFAHKIKLDKYI